MPIRVSGMDFRRQTEEIVQQMDSPELVEQLGQALSEELVKAFTTSGLKSQSGATVRALSVVGRPERWANQYGGGWRITVGDDDALGDKRDKPMKGTLASFYSYLEGQLESEGPVIPYTPWKPIPDKYKRLLEQGRRAGMFGGKGPNYANYMWTQNYGSTKADIVGRHFIEAGVQNFRVRAGDIVDDFVRRRVKVKT